MKKITALVTSLLLAGTSAAAGQEAAPDAASPEAPVSICQIRQNPDRYVGQVVTVSGTYKTDSSHYAYLLDPSPCGRESTLSLGSKVPERENSVEVFEASEAEECRRTGQRGLCVLEASIVLRGEITLEKGSHLQPDLVHPVINPHSVLSYRFRAER
jgi:hypothetical protein